MKAGDDKRPARLNVATQTLSDASVRSERYQRCLGLRMISFLDRSLYRPKFVSVQRRSPGSRASPQPAGLCTRVVDVGYFASFAVGRRGRTTNSPLQFGQVLFNFDSAQERQNVHSNVQMRASVESFGKSRLQHSQFGRSSSIDLSLAATDWYAPFVLARLTGLRFEQASGAKTRRF